MFDTEEISLEDEGPVLGRGWMHLVSMILLGVSLFLGYKLFRIDRQLAGIIMAAGAVPAVITVIQFVRLRRALGTAKLQMKEEKIPLGWSGTATYVRPLHGATVLSIEARLQCQERVEKGSGKNRREWRELVLDEPLAQQSAPMMEQLRVQIPLRIPTAGPPSFTYTDNEIIWWVRLHLRMEGCPNTRSSFRVQVAPAVVER